MGAFLLAGFLMKIVAEAIHELAGHGLLVVLFGGEIRSFYISPLWPYELSHISWSLPAHDQGAMAWAVSGGVLATSTASFLILFFLREVKACLAASVPLFWLSFWCLMNATGYLIVGGLLGFGDIGLLMGMGVITQEASMLAGVALFLPGFLLVSGALRGLLVQLSVAPTRAYLVAFWLIVPLLLVLFVAGSVL